MKAATDINIKRKTMSGLSWITYKNKKILYTDYGPSHDDNMNFLEEQGKYEENNPDLLIISDYEGTVASQEYMQKVKEYGKKYRRDRNTNVKNAVVGIKGVKKNTLRILSVFYWRQTYKGF